MVHYFQLLIDIIKRSGLIFSCEVYISSLFQILVEASKRKSSGLGLGTAGKPQTQSTVKVMYNSSSCAYILLYCNGIINI